MSDQHSEPCDSKILAFNCWYYVAFFSFIFCQCLHQSLYSKFQHTCLAAFIGLFTFLFFISPHYIFFSSGKPLIIVQDSALVYCFPENLSWYYTCLQTRLGSTCLSCSQNIMGIMSVTVFVRLYVSVFLTMQWVNVC